ncbi:MAG TPA: hypothetical protein VMG40_20245 [Bryobacteraceae bacterium]|nr:hypothetical protein [Bryobacteraceae bacterium]
MDILEQSLGRVEAPAELWDRVLEGRSSRRVSAPHRRAWIAALACAAAAMVWAMVNTPSLRSDDPAVVREWVKARTGMDVPLARSQSVRLTGARVVNSGRIELAYRAGDRAGVVTISRIENGRAHWGALAVDCQAPACGLCHS